MLKIVFPLKNALQSGLRSQTFRFAEVQDHVADISAHRNIFQYFLFCLIAIQEISNIKMIFTLMPIGFGPNCNLQLIDKQN